jgi:plasmid stabilization system protein ParE
MHDVAYAPEAEAQLVALYFHIAAAASPEIAANDTDAIVQQCETLMTFPKRSARGGATFVLAYASLVFEGAFQSPAK